MKINQALQLLNRNCDKLFQLLHGAHQEQLETTQIQPHFHKILRISYITLLKDTGSFHSCHHIKVRSLLTVLLLFFTEVRFNLSREIVEQVFLEFLKQDWPTVQMQSGPEEIEDDKYHREILKYVLTSATKERFPWKPSSFEAVFTLSVTEMPIVIKELKQRFKHSFLKLQWSSEQKDTCQPSDPIDGIGD